MKRAEENNISVYRLVAATEVDYWADYNEVNLTDDQFEDVCSFVYEWISSTDASATEVARLFFRVVEDIEGFSYDEIWEFEEEIVGIMNSQI